HILSVRPVLSSGGWPTGPRRSIVVVMKRLYRRRAAGSVALMVAVALVTACGGTSSTTWRGPGSPPSAGASATPSPSAATGQPVHVRLYESDGATYGVGIPIIAYVSANITDA